MLEVRDLQVNYGGIVALKNLNLEIKKGEIVALIGANGAGKTTTLKAICGLLKPVKGEIIFEGEILNGKLASEIVKRGIAYVPEGRRIFSRLTVRENLLLGAYTYFSRNRKEALEKLAEIYRLFPILEERANQLAGTLSGGEQQMLAIGRGLMAQPRLLLLDEPSLGLAPKIVEILFSVIQEINRRGTTILLVEQNVKRALEISSRGYVLETGRVVLTGSSENLLRNESVRKAYLGEFNNL